MHEYTYILPAHHGSSPQTIEINKNFKTTFVNLDVANKEN